MRLFQPAAIALTTLSFLAEASTAAEKRPNMIVILADDLGRGDYSAFGTPDIQTPAIDRLFAEGAAMDHFFANCPVCSPTRAALLTGCYPDRVGVPGVIRDKAANSWGNLADDAVMIPKHLQGAGYHSAIVGKWHLGLESPDTPMDRGFHHFHGFLGDMMDDYWTHLRNGHNFMRHDRDVIDPEGHATDLFTQWACDYITQRSTEDAPFFLYLAYNAPHDPIQPPPDWVEKVKAREPGMSDIRAKLVALIEHMDHGIGKVLDTLDQLNLTDDTLVIFTSDNGGVLKYEANNGPWRSEKQHMYEGGLRVPFAARWPGQIEAGAHLQPTAISMDIAATLCDIAGVKTPETMDGISLKDVLTGQAEALPERDHYFVRREGGPAYGGLTIQALRRGDWKIVHDSPFAPQELYNMKADPKETNEMSKKAPKIFNDLRTALQAEVQKAGSVPWQ